MRKIGSSDVVEVYLVKDDAEVEEAVRKLGLVKTPDGLYINPKGKYVLFTKAMPTARKGKT